MTAEILRRHIADGSLDMRFAALYGEDRTADARRRYTEVLDDFITRYGASSPDVSLFSVPGRSELSGNHTDHNHGKVIAASIDLDIIAAAARTSDNIVRVKSAGHDENVVDLGSYTTPDSAFFGLSDALIAGVADAFVKKGHRVGGFSACTSSNVLKGSGLSSSAAFENMMGTLFSHLYNDGEVGYVEIAQDSQYAENAFFGKPCGLMDQVACAAGGIVSIDFADPSKPVIEKLGFDLGSFGYCLCIVNTGGNHADLTDDYAAVPAEMKAVAAHFGKAVLRDVPENEFYAAIPALRTACGDRAVLRAIHFFDENRRVDSQRRALAENDLEAYFEGVRASGLSSFRYLQNVYTNKNVAEQGLSLALCLTEHFFDREGVRGVCRVHGGGFAGTIQAYVPADRAADYAAAMNAVFGADSCYVLRIRRSGAVKVF